MNPRVSRSRRAREQGDRLPDRQDRGAPRGGLPARRDHQRHHRRDAGVVRADDRLRRHQDAALGVREAPRRVAGAGHDDAVGRRGDGDRPHLHRSAAEGAALAGDRPRGLNCDPDRARVRRRTPTTTLVRMVGTPTPERPFLLEAALRRGVSVERLHEATGIDPWFLDHLAALVEPRADARGARRRRRCHAREWRTVEAPRVLRRAARLPVGVAEAEVRDGAASRAGVAVTYKTVDTCAAEFAASTPYHYGTYEDEDEVAPLRRARGRHPRQRPEPHRPGRRVRLLLRARRVRARPTPASRR